ncbi:hypothetical protein FVEN_g8678 [Fusarium venenatum]|nr:hypothetical protein FVEN_g8678 [Fusarium venenatum]
MLSRDCRDYNPPDIPVEATIANIPVLARQYSQRLGWRVYTTRCYCALPQRRSKATRACFSHIEPECFSLASTGMGTTNQI